jgi:hypothetical protein
VDQAPAGYLEEVMTDRELLELAAKAVGYRITWGEVHRVGDDEVDCSDLCYVLSDSPDEAPSYWNPLTDDGDALRLAVKLGLYIGGKFTAHQSVSEFVELGELAAVRRAIVRAAAEIGKAMP